MRSFILISFALMGWAFYQLSGGSDFAPPHRPVVATTTAAKTPAPVAVATNNPTLVRAAPRAPAPPPQQAAAESTDQPEPPRDPATGRIVISLDPVPGDNTINPDGTLASLAQLGTDFTVTRLDFDPTVPAAVRPAPTSDAPPAPDMREITGTRVNMRDGPGTVYPVTARLALGQEVEVLDVSGTGWLRLRTFPDQQIGWVATSLVSKSGG